MVESLLEMYNGKEPNWAIQMLLGSVLGSLFGLALPHIGRALKGFVLLFQKHTLEDMRWEYHYSTLKGIDRLFEASIRIRPGLTGTLVFKLGQEDTKLKYKGKVVMEKGSDQFLLLGRSQDPANEERIMWRAHLGLSSTADIITGVHMSYNHDKEPYASIAILCNTRVGLAEAAKIIDKVRIDTKGLPLLRVKKIVPVISGSN